MPTLLEHLTTPTPDEIDQIRTIYETNFPPVMQKPFRVIADGSRDRSVTVLVARDSDQPETIIGIATLAALPRTADALYLGYLATDPLRHNQGIGGALVDFMVAFVNQNLAHVSAIVWEVEGPEPDRDHLHNRRVRFYERHGARVVTQVPTYRMPTGEANGDTIPLRLMWIPVQGRTRAPDRAEISAWINGIYDLVYPGDKALAGRIIAELDEPPATGRDRSPLQGTRYT